MVYIYTKKIKKILEFLYYISRQIYIAIVFYFYLNIPKCFLKERFDKINDITQILIYGVLALLFNQFIFKLFTLKNKYISKNSEVQMMISFGIIVIFKILIYFI